MHTKQNLKQPSPISYVKLSYFTDGLPQIFVLLHLYYQLKVVYFQSQ